MIMIVRLRTFWIVLALILGTAPVASETVAVSGEDLATSCANYPDSSKPRMCEMYASELLDIVRTEDKLRNPLGRLCLPPDVPLPKVISLINSWLAGHPELLQKRAYQAGHGALRRDYPCK